MCVSEIYPCPSIPPPPASSVCVGVVCAWAKSIGAHSHVCRKLYARRWNMPVFRPRFVKIYVRGRNMSMSPRDVPFCSWWWG